MPWMNCGEEQDSRMRVTWFRKMKTVDGRQRHSNPPRLQRERVCRGVLTNRLVLENNDGGCFVDKGEGSTNSKKNLPVISEGSIPLAAPKEKDKDGTTSSG